MTTTRGRCAPGEPCDRYARLMTRAIRARRTGDQEESAHYAGLAADHRRLSRLEREVIS
jgi:hypothetical protein